MSSANCLICFNFQDTLQSFTAGEYSVKFAFLHYLIAKINKKIQIPINRTINRSMKNTMFFSILVKNFDPRLSPWPLRYEHWSYTWHNVLPRRTFVMNNLKIHPCMVELKPNKHQNCPLCNLWPQFMTLTFKLWACISVLTYCLA